MIKFQRKNENHFSTKIVFFDWKRTFSIDWTLTSIIENRRLIVFSIHVTNFEFWFSTSWPKCSKFWKNKFEQIWIKKLLHFILAIRMTYCWFFWCNQMTENKILTSIFMTRNEMILKTSKIFRITKFWIFWDLLMKCFWFFSLNQISKS